MKFKVGDTVLVRDDLKVGKLYYHENNKVGDTFSNMMRNNLGKRAKIVGIERGLYVLDIDVFHRYTDGMLETVEENCKRKDGAHMTALYTFDENVEKIVNQMLKLVPEQLINHAIDTENKELFDEVSRKYYSDYKCKN
jgi:hypothetical protein